jgi:hypothetical protein
MKAHVVVFAIITAFTTGAAVAAEGNAMEATQSARKWWQPDPNSFQFQIQKQNQALKQEGFDPYSP